MQRPLKKIEHARKLVAHTLRQVERDLMPLNKAQLLIYGSKVLGGLINDSGTEAELDQMRAELAELKAKIGLRVA